MESNDKNENKGPERLIINARGERSGSGGRISQMGLADTAKAWRAEMSKSRPDRAVLDSLSTRMQENLQDDAVRENLIQTKTATDQIVKTSTSYEEAQKRIKDLQDATNPNSAQGLLLDAQAQHLEVKILERKVRANPNRQADLDQKREETRKIIPAIQSEVIDPNTLAAAAPFERVQHEIVLGRADQPVVQRRDALVLRAQHQGVETYVQDVVESVVRESVTADEIPQRLDRQTIEEIEKKYQHTNRAYGQASELHGLVAEALEIQKMEVMRESLETAQNITPQQRADLQTLNDNLNRQRLWPAGQPVLGDIGREAPFAAVNEAIYEVDVRSRASTRLRDRRDFLISEAEQTGALRMDELRDKLTQIIKENAEPDVVPELRAYQRTVEEELLKNPLYKNNPVYHGMGEALVNSAIIEVQIHQKLRDPNVRLTPDDDARLMQEHLIVLYPDSTSRENALTYEKKNEGLVPKENTPDGWIELVMTTIMEAEVLSEQRKSRSTEPNARDPWDRCEQMVKLIPEKFGDRLDRNNPEFGDLVRLYERQYPDGMFLKERLEVYLNAKRRLNDRYVEIVKAEERIADMGVGSDDAPFEGIRIIATELKPSDLWVLIHSDSMFRGELSNRRNARENAELVPDVSHALSVWYQAGIDYREYKDALNDNEKMKNLRAKLARQSGSKSGEETAHRILEVTLSKALFDKNRGKSLGNNEPRGIMHAERDRYDNFVVKMRAPDVEWTVGRYWAVPGQGTNLRALAGQFSAEERVERAAILVQNTGRSVFQTDETGADKAFDKGEMLSDFFGSVTISVPDHIDPLSHQAHLEYEAWENSGRRGPEPASKGDRKQVKRKLMSYFVDANDRVMEGGFKRMPLLTLTDETYIQYFKYNLATANKLVDTIMKKQKMKDLVDGLKGPDKGEGFWESLMTTTDKIAVVSPWLNAVEDEMRAYRMRVTIAELADPSWTDTQQEKLDWDAKTARLTSFSSFEDLEEAGFTPQEAQFIIGHRNFDYFAENAKSDADEYVVNSILGLRYVTAIGVFWEGSLARMRSLQGNPVSRLLQESAMEPEIANQALRAMRASHFFPEDEVGKHAYENLRSEIFVDLGIGPRFVEAAKPLIKRRRIWPF